MPMPLSYWFYIVELLGVGAFWYFLARKRLFGAAMLHAIGYPLFATYLIPIARGWLNITVTMGQTFALVLLVEAFRQGLFKRVRLHMQGVMFVRLVLLLFLVSVSSYILGGTAEFSDPVGFLTNRFISEVVPVSILALAINSEEISQAWRSGLWASGIISAAYLFQGLGALLAGGSGQDLRAEQVLKYGLGGGGVTSISFAIFSAYNAESSKQRHTKSITLFAAAVAFIPILAVLSATRSILYLFPLVLILLLLVKPPQGIPNIIFGIISSGWALILALSLSSLFFPGVLESFGEQYSFLRARLAGDYGAAGGSGRVEMWQQGWNMFLEHPILGVGEGNSGTISSTYIATEGRLHTFRMAQHSLYIKYLAEQGLIGGGLLFLIIGLFLVNAKRLLSRTQSSGPERLLARGAVVLGVVGLASAVAGDGRLFFPGAALLMSCANVAAHAVSHMPSTIRAETLSLSHGSSGSPSSSTS